MPPDELALGVDRESEFAEAELTGPGDRGLEERVRAARLVGRVDEPLTGADRCVADDASLVLSYPGVVREVEARQLPVRPDVVGSDREQGGDRAQVVARCRADVHRGILAARAVLCRKAPIV